MSPETKYFFRHLPLKTIDKGYCYDQCHYTYGSRQYGEPNDESGKRTLAADSQLAGNGKCEVQVGLLECKATVPDTALQNDLLF
jgi:hypothetical protein